MNEQKVFENIPGRRPKAANGIRVVGERGRNPPPGERGGETLKPDRHEEHKRHAFDSFCKKALKYEAYNGYREISRRRKREVSLSELPEEAMEQLAVCDQYPCEQAVFQVGGDAIPVENDRLADALDALPQESRDILLMYWFLDLSDREIADRLHMARRTVNTHRRKAYQRLKELMGGEADG